jgi:hypothetical protein
MTIEPVLDRPKVIQEKFGQNIIDTITQFARQDLDTVAELESKYLFHVSDSQLRTILAETLYGARWLYKLGLALLVKDAEQMAHVRAQMIDYCSVCEGVLSDAIMHSIKQNYISGSKYLYSDVVNLRHPITWTASNTSSKIKERNLKWFIEVAFEEGIIDLNLYNNLEWLRKQRNAVHLRSRTFKAYLGKSRYAFNYMKDLFVQTQKWKAKHP